RNEGLQVIATYCNNGSSEGVTFHCINRWKESDGWTNDGDGRKQRFIGSRNDSSFQS
ncbi:hypothetical protein HAX54_050066, partial [Datura stramonium]|nr:hypothetical protein [Datura stramonium]